MSRSKTKKQQSKKHLSDKVIHIVSPYPFNRKVLAHQIMSRTKAICYGAKQLKEVKIKPQKSHDINPQLILCDCLGMNRSEIINGFLTNIGTITDASFIALYNFPFGLKIENRCVNIGICGVFYEDEELDLFIDGIAAIYKGELWYSRKIFTKFILGIKEEKHNSKKNNQLLTQRESEILSLLAIGCSNSEISEKLHISTHTIKTHLSNIYRKINVNSRLQASYWVSKNL